MDARCGNFRGMHTRRAWRQPGGVIIKQQRHGRAFTASESTVLVAISNAFTTGNASNPAGYRGMMLCPAAEQSYLVPNWHPTNGFVLFPLMGPIASVPLQGRAQLSVPYTAYFYLTTTPVDSSHTSVSVRTILAKVTDGKEVGVHGGWANHERNVPPVKAEEDNVLIAVSNAVGALHIPGKSSP
jgi:hypothetical protein